MYSLDFVKQVLEQFIVENESKSFVLKDKDGNSKINLNILEIENYLIALRKQHSINLRLDAAISIKDYENSSIGSDSSFSYRAVDYQYNFLYHLAVSYVPNLDLYWYVDSFIDKFKSQLSISDIVITKSGATRCKTNIRFALNDLRDLYLVISRDEKNKRSWQPSVLGLMALLVIDVDGENLKHEPFYRSPDLLTRNIILNSFAYDLLLIAALRKFKDAEYLPQFISKLQSISLDNRENDLLQNIIIEFGKFTMEGLDMSEGGIKKTKLFDKLSKAFQSNLMFEQPNHSTLHGKLFRHFKDSRSAKS
jgi:hypothetical protein